MSEAKLVKRLERLERDNRRLKRIGVAALVVATALGTMAATRPVPNVIKAREFDAVDSSGRVRVVMSTLQYPRVTLLDAEGRIRADMGYVEASSTPYLALGMPTSSGPGGYRADVEITDSPSHGPLVQLGGRRSANGLLTLTATPAGLAGITLVDGQGLGMDPGAGGTAIFATGATQPTSAASIVMFGKKGQVIWHAPQ